MVSPLYCLCWDCWNREIAKDMGIDRRYEECTFENYDDRFNDHRGKVKIIRAQAEKRNSMILCGSTIGVGKTHLIVAAA